MTTPALLDLNDSNLQLWHRGEAVQSPGYALLNGTQYTFGSNARAAARLRPRDINTRYWWQLNTEGLQPALGPARHTADLVHAHLLDMHKQAGGPAKLVLAVPGSMARNQLALLLGIVGQCPFDAVGLVNRSVALASAYPGPGQLYHLEIQLHQAVITELGRNNGLLESRRITPLPGCGLLQLQERLVEIIAAAFIRQTRFDPRRKADSEQQLYDKLPAVLRSLGKAPEANIEVMGYRARINRSELRSAGAPLFSSAPEATGILQPSDKIIVDPVAGLLPGLMEHLPQAELVDNSALPTAVEQHLDRLLHQATGDEESLHFVTSLPCPEEAANPVAAASTVENSEPLATPEPQGTPPTHLLQDAVATPLVEHGTPLGKDAEVYCEAGRWLLRPAAAISLNGKPYRAGQAVYAGDSVRCAATTAGLLITVLKP